MGLGKEYPPDLPGQERYIVEFAGEDDPMHPHNWPTSKKRVQCVRRKWEGDDLQPGVIEW